MRHDNFSDEYKTKPIPPLPPTIDVSRARDVHQSRLEELDEAYVDRLPPRPPIEKPRPPPQIPRHFKNPQVEDEYDLQRPVMQALSPQEQMIKELRNRTPRPTTTQNTEPYDDVEATQPSSKPTPTPRQRQMPRK
uniref:Uncharacterized protein LOC102805221 n=1 Tax=Saccoglossus kowalevskii TaxID=10224 RepID=A0ABM0M1Z8_SACKO|nr:PREDICTED: uncharacterized protein LOC102805221 [Saccoglossus kowalevskii]